MKKINLSMALVALGAMLVSCGGGSGAGRNDYLGNLPALYEKYNKAEADLQVYIEGKSMEQITKAYADVREQEKQLEIDVAAELQKLNGKEIPVTYSDALTASGQQYYNAIAAVMADGDVARLSLTFTAKDAFEASKFEKNTLYLCYADNAGVAIEGTKYSMGSVVRNKPSGMQIAAGDQLFKDESFRVIEIEKNPAGYATMASVRFITKEEYDAL